MRSPGRGGFARRVSCWFLTPTNIDRAPLKLPLQLAWCAACMAKGLPRALEKQLPQGTSSSFQGSQGPPLAGESQHPGRFSSRSLGVLQPDCKDNELPVPEPASASCRRPTAGSSLCTVCPGRAPEQVPQEGERGQGERRPGWRLPGGAAVVVLVTGGGAMSKAGFSRPGGPSRQEQTCLVGFLSELREPNPPKGGLPP